MIAGREPGSLGAAPGYPRMGWWSRGAARRFVGAGKGTVEAWLTGGDGCEVAARE